jgi:hypothetical protein
MRKLLQLQAPTDLEDYFSLCYPVIHAKVLLTVILFLVPSTLWKIAQLIYLIFILLAKKYFTSNAQAS